MLLRNMVILMVHFPGFVMTTFQLGFLEVPKFPTLQTVRGELLIFLNVSPFTDGFRGTDTDLYLDAPCFGRV